MLICKSDIVNKILENPPDNEQIYTVEATEQELEEIKELSKKEIPLQDLCYGDLKDNLLNYSAEKADSGYIVKVKFSNYIK